MRAGAARHTRSCRRPASTPLVRPSIAALALLVSGQVSLALNIAVFALVVLYFIHSLALLALPTANPELYHSASLALPRWIQRLAAVVSMLVMGALVVMQVATDVGVLRRLTFRQRLDQASLTTIELMAFWTAIGVVLYMGRRARMVRAPR